MVDESTANCIRESEIDTIEIALRKRVEDLISSGDIKEAEIVEDTIKSLDDLNVCDEPVKQFAYESKLKWLREAVRINQGAIGGKRL